MPIEFPFKFDRVKQSVNLKKFFGDNNHEWIVWWYCGINKNLKASCQPYVLVAFRLIVGNRVSEGSFFRRVLLTNLGSLRIGSVWRYGKCIKIARFEERNFSVNFKNNYWHTSFCEASRNGWESPFDLKKYPLEYGYGDKNFLLQFKAGAGELVAIPSLEFYSRMYGGSEELKRVLATYSRTDCKKYFFRSINQPEEDNIWKISRRKKLRKSDNVFLAHFKYDDWTRTASSMIYGQIEAQYDPDTAKLIFIKVDPWFRTPTRLTVRGISYNDGKSFLGLQIMGYDLPQGPDIYSLLKPRNVSNQEELYDVEKCDRGRAIVNITTPPEEAVITGDSEPNSGGSISDIKNMELKVRNPGRAIIEEYDGSAGGESQPNQFSNVESAQFSTGEQQGSDGKVGLALIHTPHVEESEGTLYDIWNAFLYLKKKYPQNIESVEWFTYADGLKESTDFKLIRIEDFEDENEVEGEVLSWVFMDLKKKDQTRGALVAKLVVNGLHVYIVEIQRRPTKKKDVNGNIVIGEESMTGLVFSLDDQRNLTSWLRLLFDEIRNVKGVFKKVTGLCPGNASFFKHPKSSSQNVPEEASARNALSKLDIFL